MFDINPQVMRLDRRDATRRAMASGDGIATRLSRWLRFAGRALGLL